jgi:hypothetical protein
MGTVVCRNCGKSQHVPPSREKRGYLFCSLECRRQGGYQPQRSFDEVFAQRVDVGLCWEWTGASNNGYGKAFFEGRIWLAHRLVWTMLVGPILDDLVLDHLCRNTICVNPDHLEVVTLAENKRRGYSKAAINARKTHCKKGHPFDERSIRADGTGRRCRICAVEDERERQRRIREGW